MSITVATARHPGARALTWLRRDAIPIVVMLALALLALAPVLPAPRTTIPGWYGDNVQHLYGVGWMAQAPLLGLSPFTDPRLNYPDDLDLMATELAYLSNLAVAPITWVLGPVFSYNLIIFLGLFLSGYFTYLWALRVTGGRAGALAAGAIFLLSPYRLAHAVGHLQLVATFGLPLFFWALDDTLTRAGRRWAQALGLAGATFLVGSASQYYLVICLVIGAGYALMLTLPDLGALARRGWLAALAVVAGALVSAAPYLAIVQSGVLESYNIRDTRLWSADPLNFLLPHQDHPLWGQLIKAVRPEPYWVEKTLYVGLVALALAVFAIIATRGGQRRRVLSWAGAAALAALFALGTDLHINNQPLSADSPLWLPAYYLGQLPFVQMIRVWARFGVVTALFVALLAGVGVSLVAARLRGRRTLALALIGALLVIDLAPMRLQTTPVGERAVDRWLAAQPPDVLAAPLPAYNNPVNYGSLFGSLFHGHHLPAYMHPVHMTPAYARFRELAIRFPAPGVASALRAQGYDYLLLERKYFNGTNAPDWPLVEAGLAADKAPIIAELDGVVVVDLRADAPDGPP
ncbi:MAG: hypothetical protein HGA45_09180 [Chloroflexales bacterium]|nr:hypothetical protein [Chloroflexales bacterium]